MSIRMFILMILLPVCLISSEAKAEQYDLGKSHRWIVVESRQTFPEANQLAVEYVKRFPNTRIFRSTNGWYAVTIGGFERRRAPDLVKSLSRDGLIPIDSYLAQGKDFSSMSLPKATASEVAQGGEKGAGSPVRNAGSEMPFWRYSQSGVDSDDEAPADWKDFPSKKQACVNYCESNKNLNSQFSNDVDLSESEIKFLKDVHSKNIQVIGNYALMNIEGNIILYNTSTESAMESIMMVCQKDGDFTVKLLISREKRSGDYFDYYIEGDGRKFSSGIGVRALAGLFPNSIGFTPMDGNSNHKLDLDEILPILESNKKIKVVLVYRENNGREKYYINTFNNRMADVASGQFRRYCRARSIQKPAN